MIFSLKLGGQILFLNRDIPPPQESNGPYLMHNKIRVYLVLYNKANFVSRIRVLEITVAEDDQKVKRAARKRMARAWPMIHTAVRHLSSNDMSFMYCRKYV